MNIFYGIDFGTTNTAVVKITENADGEYKVVNLGEEGNYPFASVAAVPKPRSRRQTRGAGVMSAESTAADTRTMQFGRAVKRRRHELTDEYYVISSLKTLINNGSDVMLGDKRLSAVKIIEFFLRYVKKYVFDKWDSDISRAVFAVPVDFSPEARVKLAIAARAAGIVPTGFVVESTAAYIANRRQVEAFPRVMVADWGGGTFDVSVLEPRLSFADYGGAAGTGSVSGAASVADDYGSSSVSGFAGDFVNGFASGYGGNFVRGSVIKSVAGGERTTADNFPPSHVMIHERAVFGRRIGGDNADEALAKKIHAKLAALEDNLPAFDDPEMTKTDRDNILAACEQIKLNFSSDNGDADVVLRNYCGKGTKNITISYNAFAQAIYPVVDGALQVIDEAMEKADLGIDDIDCIILVGGSCQLRLFRELVAEFFGGENLVEPEKMQWSVAEGAAITAARGCVARLEDDVCVSLAGGGRFPLLRKGTAAPYESETMTFAITEDAPHANFVFTSGSGTEDYGFHRIRSKGFLRELINVKSYLNADLTADFVIENPAMGEGYSLKHTVTNLKYYYEI